MTCRRPASIGAYRAALANLALAMISLLLTGCAARRAFDPYHGLDPGYRVATVQGTQFAHAVVVPGAQTSAPTLWVFLEGDGEPWVDGGRRIARDPSPKNALAFDLFKASSVARAYVGRPCYFSHAHDVDVGKVWQGGGRQRGRGARDADSGKLHPPRHSLGL